MTWLSLLLTTWVVSSGLNSTKFCTPYEGSRVAEHRAVSPSVVQSQMQSTWGAPALIVARYLASGVRAIATTPWSPASNIVCTGKLRDTRGEIKESESSHYYSEQDNSGSDFGLIRHKKLIRLTNLPTNIYFCMNTYNVLVSQTITIQLFGPLSAVANHLLSSLIHVDEMLLFYKTVLSIGIGEDSKIIVIQKGEKFWLSSGI